MKNKVVKSATVLVTLSTAILPARAQDASQESAWARVSLSYRAAFNISADFSGVGGFTSLNTPGGTGQIAGAPGTVVRTYDDGFIGIDNSGNAGGRTTYWGFNDAAQVVGGAVQMHSSSVLATSSGNVDEGAQHSFELSYQHPMGGRDHWRWGVEGALNWMDIGIQDSTILVGDVVTVTHAFALNGVIPPVAPPTYVGPVSGPGPLLSDNAVDISGPPQTGSATITGKRSITANLYGLRLGPYLEYDLGKHVFIGMSGGFSVGLINSEFEYSDVVTVTGLGSSNTSGRDQSTKFLYGGYVRGQVGVRLSKSVSLFGGAEFSSLSRFTQSANTAKARLDLGSAVYVTGGISYDF